MDPRGKYGLPGRRLCDGAERQERDSPEPRENNKKPPPEAGEGWKTQFWGNVQKAAGYAAPDSLATAVSPPTELRRASLGSLWLWLWLSEESALEALSAFMRLS